jgi:hypothetical protein
METGDERGTDIAEITLRAFKGEVAVAQRFSAYVEAIAVAAGAASCRTLPRFQWSLQPTVPPKFDGPNGTHSLTVSQ